MRRGEQVRVISAMPGHGDNGSNVDEGEIRKGSAGMIRVEDCSAAPAPHCGARSGPVDHFLIGRNESAPHNWHGTHRQIPRLSPVEAFSL